MASNLALRARQRNWRLDSMGRLLGRYQTCRLTVPVWEAATRAGVPESFIDPAGCSTPWVAAEDVTDSYFSEFVLRAWEAGFERGDPNNGFPSLGFKPDLRGIAYNLDFAGQVLGSLDIRPTRELIPMDILEFCALRASMRAGDQLRVLNAVAAEVTKGETYPALAGLWNERSADIEFEW